MTDPRTFGPFVHTLNKGGLREIVTSGKLRGTPASNHLANDHLAVRAYAGSFEHQKRNKNWSGRISRHIEFVSHVAPRPGLPPGYAEWTDEQLIDGHLRIQILRVLDGEGSIVTP
ncbi:hypothetical protein WKW79_06205 [Variovorax robiniae]|uniref:Uncharacterized protein n=1 Tax=Variovorax robiniae TaxID=1836199 RepID=A0ABU8X4Y5_9BURK